MIFSLMSELNKIIDVIKNRKLKFIFKYGILRAMLYMTVFCVIFTILSVEKYQMSEVLINSFIKIMCAILPGIIWGIVDYVTYKDIIEEKKNYRINGVLYIFMYGFLGWGVLCGISNITFIPFDKISIIAAIVTIPIYGVILGIVSRKFINVKLIRQLYNENLKGKNVSKVVKRGTSLKLK